MKTNSTTVNRLIQFRAKRLAPILMEFRAMTAEEEQQEQQKPMFGHPAGIAARAALGGGAVYGTNKVVGAVSNRLGGMRGTIPGFAQRSTVGQVGAAAGDVAKDAVMPLVNKIKPLAGKAVGAGRAGIGALLAKFAKLKAAV